MSDEQDQKPRTIHSRIGALAVAIAMYVEASEVGESIEAIHHKFRTAFTRDEINEAFDILEGSDGEEDPPAITYVVVGTQVRVLAYSEATRRSI